MIIKILINTAVGVILMTIWLQLVDEQGVISTISKVNFINLLPIFLFLFLAPAIRALRLKIFLAPLKSVSLKDLVFLNGVAAILNFFIPIRAGEIAKGIYLNTNYDLPLKSSIVWIFLDRFVDFLIVLLISGLLILFIPTELPSNFAPALAVILIISLTSTYLIIFKSNFAKKIVNFLSFLLIVKYIKIQFILVSTSILESFSILNRSPKDLLIMITLTILAYFADGMVWYLLFNILGNPQPFINMYLGQLLSALTYLIPAAPGYVGSAEASGLLILSGVFGLDKDLSSVMIVLFHILTAIFILVYGLFSIYLLKVNLGLILKKALRKNG